MKTFFIFIILIVFEISNAQTPPHKPGEVCILRTGWCWKKDAHVANASTGECFCKLADLPIRNSDLLRQDVWIPGCLDAPTTLVCENLVPKKPVIEKQTVGEFIVECPESKKVDNCFARQESLYQKLGCHIAKGNCEVKLNAKNNMISCQYTSSDCLPSIDKTCKSGYDSRWLDGEKSNVICVSAPSNTPAANHKSEAVK